MTGQKPLKILFVEDKPADVALAERELCKNKVAYTSLRVDTKEGLQEALTRFIPDIVVSDFSLPLFDGMSALRFVKDYAPDTPFLIMTGSMNEEVAAECMKAGASDFIIKEHLSRFAYAVGVAMEHKQLRLSEKQQDEKLRQSEERYHSIFQDSNAIMLIIDPKNFAIVDANKTAVAFYGWPYEVLVKKTMLDLNSLPLEVMREQYRQAMAKEKSFFIRRHLLADGSMRDIEVYVSPVKIGGKGYLYAVIHDISYRVALEQERDLIAQKLSYYLQMSPTITYTLELKGGSARLVWVSENIRTILGYLPEDTLEADWWFQHVFQADRETALQGIPLVIQLGSYAHEYRFVKKDRALLWLHDSMRLIKRDAGNAEIIGTLTDITEKKRVEEKAKLQSTALEALDTAVLITDRNGTIEWANRAFNSLTGYTLSETLGKNPRDLIKSDKQDPSVYRSLWDTILSGKSWRGDILNKKKSGQEYH